MCGIAGIYGWRQPMEREAAMERMLGALKHRGPDAGAFHSAGACTLGHRRLSIIDLAASSNQPMVSPDGRWVLCFNGEIYNYKSLKAELGHYPFITQGDSEVLLAAFITWGPACLQRLAGMFAFAIHDTHTDELFLVRDRLGIKPLYYSQLDDGIVFASEIRALLASSAVAPVLDKRAVVDYLRYQTVHTPGTMVHKVFMLNPATYLRWHDGELSEHLYWQPWMNAHHDREATTVRRNVKRLFTEAVERRLVADVPFGAFLSGGIDSSLVVAAMAREMGRPVDTFNVSFDESAFSEARFAAMVAKKYGTHHHEIRLKPTDFLNDLPQAVASIDHPSGDGPNTWVVSKHTKASGITMALSGLGGDELFAGYPVFKQLTAVADKGWLLSFPKILRRLAGFAMRTAKPSVASDKTAELLASDYFNLRELYPVFRKVLLDGSVQKLLARPLPKNSVQGIVDDLELFSEFAALPVLSRISVAEMRTYMLDVLLRDADQMSMAHALEVRVPFLDHHLVEYVCHIPDAVKYPHSPKQLLVESFSDWLLPEVVNRPKMGFVLPWEQWMRGELRGFCETSLAEFAHSGVCHPPHLMALWQRFLNGDKRVTWSRVWPLVVLSKWMNENAVRA